MNDRLEADHFVIGSGIVGLAVAWHLRDQGKVIVVDKEPSAAFHQTGRNSGIVHSGIYYQPGSLKAHLCTEGRAQLEALAADHGIPLHTTGKLIVANSKAESDELDKLADRGHENGLSGLRALSSDEATAIEPEVRAANALLVPQTGLIDYRAAASALVRDIEEAGGELMYGFDVESVESTTRPAITAVDGRRVVADSAVNCAGLHSDRVARLAGAEPDIQIIPFRGIYYRLAVPALVTRPIYPVPDPRLPFLGVHVTPTITGDLEVGPNAVLATGREAYRFTDVDWTDLRETLGYRGFRRLAKEYWRVGATEIRRTLSRRAFANDVRRLVPAVKDSWLIPAGSGIRAQALDQQGRLVDDFVFERTENVLHVLNAPSPAATASLAIGAAIAGRI